jgi:hypothetical protein
VLELELPEVVIGHSPESVDFAYRNHLSIITNSSFKVHSYEREERQISDRMWQLSMAGHVPFTTVPSAIDLKNKFLVHHLRSKTKITCPKVHLFSLEKIAIEDYQYEVQYYRVIDWFDTTGPSELLFDTYPDHGKVKNIQSFATRRIDHKNFKKDIFVEQHLLEEDLRDLNYSDTAMRHLLSKNISAKHAGIDLRLWKRDVYPVEKPFHYVLES